MNSTIKRNECQIHCLQSMSESIGTFGVLRQRLNRLKRIVKRRWRYIINWCCGVKRAKGQASCNEAKDTTVVTLRPGDLVRVRSRQKIQDTLDNWNQLRGCSFMKEMWPYCGTTQRIFKRVEKFLDERDYLLKHCTGIVLLEGMICEGTKDFGPCDRSCFFFWKEEWLEKLDEGS